MSSPLRNLTALVFCILLVDTCFAQDTDIVGPTTENEILNTSRIYQIYVDRYTPSQEAVDFLNAYPDTVSIKVFMGTWCKESKKYIPGLMKTLQVVNRHNFRVEYTGIDPEKKYLKSLSKKFDIKYIPTVVVLKGYTEVGRIEEIPRHQIETDLVRILKEAMISD